MNELKIFDEREVLGKQFRIYGTPDNPLFLAKDVGNWIEHTKPDVMLKSIDDGEKIKVNNVYVENRTGGNGVWFLTEHGLYEVLFQSRKPIAKAFKKEVKQILKSIRKNGVYMTDQKAYDIVHNPNSLADLLLQAGEQLKKKDLIIQEMQPKAIFADAVASSHTSILVGELAKILKQNGVNIGQNRLFAVLRERGFLIKRKGSDWNMPTQKSMELGLFEMKETVISHADGHTSINKTVKVTGNGQQYFINLFLQEKVS